MAARKKSKPAPKAKRTAAKPQAVARAPRFVEVEEFPGILQPPTAPQHALEHHLTDDQLRRVYRDMVRLRTVDERMITLQRQGRVGFYGACTGQEAATLGSGFALQPEDWIFPGLREAGIMLQRGFSLVTWLAQVFGNSGDVTKGRQMPSHQAARSVNQVSWGSCIGTQISQAVGAAYAMRYQQSGAVAAAYLGDAATSSSDFHVGLNFAGVFKVPVVFLCQNNHWGISTSRRNQTASESIAIKAQAYGFSGVRVDGNDVEQVYSVVKAAVEKARAGGGPTLVELETYRIGAHSTSDDPTRYRDQAEVEVWKKRDPLERCLAALLKRKCWTKAQDERLKAELLDEVNRAITEAEALPPPALQTLFDDVYAVEPWNLTEQRAQLAASLVPTAPAGA